jgi:TRAP-type transport system periplasmic protein
MSIPRRNRLSVLLVAILFVGIICLAYSPAPAHAQAKTFNLKYSGFFPNTDPMEQTATWWCQELEKRTNGRVKITAYHGESLGKIFDAPKMLRSGIADIAQFTNATPEFPVLGGTEAPYVVPNPSVNSVKAFWTLYNKGLLKELDEFKPLWWQPVEGRNIIFKNKKVTKLEELKGMKMRGLPGLQAAFMDALGATGVGLPSSEVYTALERGTIDGLMTVPAFALNFKLIEVTKYWLWEEVSAGGNIMSMTKKLYNSFPPDIQKIIDQLNGEAQTRFVKAMKTVAESKDALRKAGYEVYELSPEEHARWVKAAQPVVEKWVKDNEAKGVPARQVVEALAGIK